MDKSQTQHKINAARRTAMLISILAKVVVLGIILLLSRFIPVGLRWVVILIFVTTILVQVMVLSRETRQRK